MTQDQWLLLALKVVLVSADVSVAVFIAQYQRLTRGRWRRDPIGVTLMGKDVLLLGLLLITTASVFFGFSRLDSRVAAWVQIAMLGLVSAVMNWRTVVFQRERDGPRKRREP